MESRNAPQLSACKHVFEYVAAFLTVRQRLPARRASKAMCKAVSAVCMEDLLRATVVQLNGMDDSHLIVASSRVSDEFPSFDVALAWSGGPTPLYEELQLRFPRTMAYGIPSRIMSVCPFPFPSGSTTTTACIIYEVGRDPPTHAVDSVVLGVYSANAAAGAPGINITVPVLITPFPMLCLDAKPEQFPHVAQSVAISSFAPIPSDQPTKQHQPLTSLRFAELSCLEAIGNYAFVNCQTLIKLYLSGLKSLRTVGAHTFKECGSLKSVGLVNLPRLESIGDSAFAACKQLTDLELSELTSFRVIEDNAFSDCESLKSVHLASLPCLTSIGRCAFARCVQLSSVDLSCLGAIRSIGEKAFDSCHALTTVHLTNLALLESIGKGAFTSCTKLATVEFSRGLTSLRTIGANAFAECASLTSVSLANMPHLESIGERAFAECKLLASVDVTGLTALSEVGAGALGDNCALRRLDCVATQQK